MSPDVVLRHILAGGLGAGLVTLGFLAAGGASGAVLAGTATGGALRPTAAAPSEPATRAGPSTSACEPLRRDHEALRGEVAGLRRRLDDARRRAEVARDELFAIEGAPTPFPEDLPRPFQPEHFADALQDALEREEGYALVEAECSEYPCLAVVQTPVDGDRTWVEEIVKGWADEAGVEMGPVRLSTVDAEDLVEPVGEGSYELRLILGGPVSDGVDPERSSKRMFRRLRELKGF